MADGAKRALVTRILPVDVARHLATQSRSASFEELTAKIEGYMANMRSFEVGQKAMDVDLGAVGTEPSLDKRFEELKQQLEASQSLLASLKGGGKGGPWQGYRPGPGGGKGGKGGKGSKGGKGPGPAAIARARAGRNGGTPVCLEHQRTGKCTYQERTGRRCAFRHVEGMPSSLASVQGLLDTDLQAAGYALQVIPSSGDYRCVPIPGTKPDEHTQIASIQNDIDEIAKELGDEAFEWVLSPPPGVPVGTASGLQADAMPDAWAQAWQQVGGTGAKPGHLGAITPKNPIVCRNRFAKIQNNDDNDHDDRNDHDLKIAYEPISYQIQIKVQQHLHVNVYHFHETG